MIGRKEIENFTRPQKKKKKVRLVIHTRGRDSLTYFTNFLIALHVSQIFSSKCQVSHVAGANALCHQSSLEGTPPANMVAPGAHA